MTTTTTRELRVLLGARFSGDFRFSRLWRRRRRRRSTGEVYDGGGGGGGQRGERRRRRPTETDGVGGGGGGNRKGEFDAAALWRCAWSLCPVSRSWASGLAAFAFIVAGAPVVQFRRRYNTSFNRRVWRGRVTATGGENDASERNAPSDIFIRRTHAEAFAAVSARVLAGLRSGLPARTERISGNRADAPPNSGGQQSPESGAQTDDG